MKKILCAFLFSLLWVMGYSQHQFVISAGEYVPAGLDITTGTPYGTTNAIPNTLPGNPGGVAIPVGGAHHCMYITSSGALYAIGQNPSGALGIGNTTDQGSLVRVSQDTLGNALDPVKQAMISGNSFAQYWMSACVTTTGKLYVWGNTQGGLEGNNTAGCVASTRPVQVTATGNPFFTKVQGGYILVALDSAGNVWTCGGNNYNYYLGQGASPANFKVLNKITLPGGTKATDIASNGIFSYAVLNNGHLWAWGQQYFEDYIGISGQATLGPGGIDITPYITSYLPAGWQIAKIGVNTNCTWIRLTNGTLWTWGGTPCGDAGVGISLNFATLSNPYAWDQGPHEKQILHPTQVAPGKNNFNNIWNGLSNCFYNYVDDANGNLFAMGRNKQGAIDNGVLSANPTNGNIGATYPDSWAQAYIQAINPLAITQAIQVTSPLCITTPGANACNTYTIPTHSPPVASLIANYTGGSIYTDASASHVTDGRFIIYTILTQTGGPATLDMRIQTGLKDTISTAGGLAIPQGNYTFRMKVVNDNWDSTFATATVSVGQAPPIVTANVTTPTITFPISSDTLLGTAVPQSGATIVSVTWTQIAGPQATITNANKDTTSVTNLQQGTSTFQITAVDSNNDSTSATVSIVVLPAAALQDFLLRKKGFRYRYINSN